MALNPTEARTSEPLSKATMTHAEMLGWLRWRVEALGQAQKVAKELGVSAQYLSDILAMRRSISHAVAEAMGYERQVVFVRRKGRTV